MRLKRPAFTSGFSNSLAEGLTETIQETRFIELVTGEIPPPTIVDIEVPMAGVALTQMANGLGERLEHAAYWVAYAIVPNFQVFWLSDTVNQDHVIPAGYVMLTLVYGPVQILVALGLATAVQNLKAQEGNTSRGAPNVEVLSHVPLGGPMTVADVELEQEMHRPYAYVARLFEAGFDVIELDV